MAETTTYAIEIAVGLACLGAAAGARRRSGWLALALVVAGLAALVHGVTALAT